jgi:diaminohydroxyphosphoribosylaminopyrimidine deaminase / 5-amino-6-(5-phosphoribosylamino)uracil reductase
MEHLLPPRGLAEEVALITADKPLGRPGVAALDPDARATLADGSRYRPVETLDYGPDTMRLWERARLTRDNNQL